ncbi:hypothetical protein QYE76_021705 [Lolium multiflorum]|uniref:Uncharacterized protein n=1 Tax=Lolium multiflorum TaxID=4521 RepID=A0AAD8VTB7_LOLMU|nr:hypothetical protein QYE76_021705 [Lolium multiflorum]
MAAGHSSRRRCASTPRGSSPWPPGAADGMLRTDSAERRGEISMAAAQADLVMEDQAQVLASPGATLVGVHDGPDASRFLRSRLFPHVQRMPNLPSILRQGRAGLLERDIFDLFLPEFDKPWVIHLRENLLLFYKPLLLEAQHCLQEKKRE